MRAVGLAAASLALLFAAGCSSPSAPSREATARRTPAARPDTVPERSAPQTRIHVVSKGETIYRISKNYGSSVDAIMAANGIKDVTNVAVGTRLVVPGSGVGAAPRRTVDARTYASRDPRGQSSGLATFDWPLHGVIISEYGLRRGAHHDGLDIKAPTGTIVRAAESGRVIHADDSLSGYGNLIIIKHAGRLSSVYAHNRKMLVSVGQFVEKGDAIAEVGESGNASTPHLHFEIRNDGNPRDPLAYLK